MKPRTFHVLAGVTAAVVIAAAFAVSTKLETTALTAGTEPAFPTLEQSVNDVTRIDVQTPEAAFSLTLKDGVWGVDQKDGYPAAFEKVKSAIVGLANFKLIERKTSDPERYARLELEPAGGPEAKSKRLVLTADGGKMLADVTVGKKNPNLFGSVSAGSYIRRGDEKETWLVRGEIEIGEEPIDWMERQIVNYDSKLVRHVSVQGPDGARFAIARSAPSDENFSLQDIPEGRTMKAEDEADPLGNVMWRMMFDDVKAISGQTWPEKPWIAVYSLWEGVQVRIEVAQFDEDFWGRFVATVDETAEPEKIEAARTTASEINARVEGWSFMLTAGDSEKLTSKMEDYLAEPGADKGS